MTDRMKMITMATIVGSASDSLLATSAGRFSGQTITNILSKAVLN
jgi:hypothetical protein